MDIYSKEIYEPRIYEFYVVCEGKKKRRIDFFARSYEEACDIMQAWIEDNGYESFYESDYEGW